MKITARELDGEGTLLLSQNDYALSIGEGVKNYTIRNLTICPRVQNHKANSLWWAACFIYGWDVEAPRKAIDALMLLVLYVCFAMQVHIFVQGVTEGRWLLATLNVVGMLIGASAVAVKSRRNSD